MPRTNDSLAVLASKVPFIPLDIRIVSHVPLEEFQQLDAEGEYIGRREDDEMVVLFYRQATLVYSKIGDVVMRHWLKGTTEIKPRKR